MNAARVYIVAVSFVAILASKFIYCSGKDSCKIFYIIRSSVTLSAWDLEAQLYCDALSFKLGLLGQYFTGSLMHEKTTILPVDFG